jgi:hypothetical protein
MKKLFFIVTLLLVPGLVFAQSSATATNPGLVTQDLGFVIGSSVDMSGNQYIGYAGELPTLFTVVNTDGTISVALSDNKAQQTYVYEYRPDMTLARSRQFPNERTTLGAFTKDTDGNYYFFYAANAAGQNNSNMAMVKYDRDGKKLLTYTLIANAPNSLSGIRVPFDGGTCRLELSGDNLAVYFAREMFNGHQASYGFVLDKNTFERTDNGAATNTAEAGRKVMPYVSHSFNQFIVPVENGFLFADHGDAYPRSFAFAKWQTNNRTKRLQAFTFPGASGQNATYAEMGGVVKTASGFLFTAAYGGNANTARNVLFMTFPDDLSSITKNQYLTAYTTSDGHAAHPKIAAIGDGRYIVMWELMAFSTQPASHIVSDPSGYKSTWFMLIDETGKVLSAAKQLPQGLRLNMNDTLRYNSASGRVYWTVNVGSKGFGLWSFDPGLEINYTPDASLFNKAETADASDFTVRVNGRAGTAQTVTITKYNGSIRNLIIPDAINGLPVTEIASGAFTRAAIDTVQLPSTLKTIGDTSFWYSSLTTLTVPEGVTSIGKQAFSYCPALQSVSLPASLQTVDAFAFMDCPKLTSVTINPDCDMNLGYGAFDQCPALDAASKGVIGTY